jgi:hypothetical protein
VAKARAGWPNTGKPFLRRLTGLIRRAAEGQQDVSRGGLCNGPGRRRVPTDQSNSLACQIIDRLKTTDDQVERVLASGRQLVIGIVRLVHLRGTLPRRVIATSWMHDDALEIAALPARPYLPHDHGRKFSRSFLRFCHFANLE